MTRVRLVPAGIELEVRPRERLIDALDDRALVTLPTSCRGATCGRCRVRVERGAEIVAPADDEETRTLRALGAGEGERLGCQLVIEGEGDLELEVLTIV